MLELIEAIVNRTSFVIKRLDNKAINLSKINPSIFFDVAAIM